MDENEVAPQDRVCDNDVGGDEIAEPERKLREAKCKRKKAKQSERMRQLHADPDFKAKQSERMRQLNADPDFKAKLRESGRERTRQLNADPDFKAKQSERMRQLNADPDFNPLAALTPAQREDYDVLRKKGGYTRDEALAEVLRKKDVVTYLDQGTT